jgi:hypothetical protein
MMRTIYLSSPILALITAVIPFAGCTRTHTINTSALITTYRLPEAAPVAQLDTLDEKAAREFRTSHLAAGKCVFRGAISDAFWKDDQKLDRLLVAEQTGSGYQLFKVEFVGEKRIEHVSGERNGKPFDSIKILD